jgi:diadenosine tetraphosphate (Ap4A) HIT family hydrolase
MADFVDVPTVDCPFCSVPETRIVHGHALAIVDRDAYPVGPGHSLVIPRRHAGSFFELHTSEQAAMVLLLDQARADLEREFAPDGYTIGINDGVAAGQTVPHAHLHLIPRHRGDVGDPRGGIRWVLPAKARYWP